MASGLISREAAIAEIEDYIEEYSELEPETGFHNLKWCAMEEVKDTLLMLPAVDAIPVEWLLKKKASCLHMSSRAYQTAWLIGELIKEWQREQEG